MGHRTAATGHFSASNHAATLQPAGRPWLSAALAGASLAGFFERLDRGRIGRVESLDDELCRGDVECRAERGDHVQEPELAGPARDAQGNEYPVGRAGCLLARLGYSRVAARFLGELGQSGTDTTLAPCPGAFPTKSPACAGGVSSSYFVVRYGSG